jgi:hypothetical protein
MGLAPTALGRCGELILPSLRWQWSVRVVGGATFLAQAWATVWGVTRVLQATGKTPMGWRTLAILPGRLARCRWQHKGVAVAKMVARVGARFWMGKTTRDDSLSTWTAILRDFHFDSERIWLKITGDRGISLACSVPAEVSPEVSVQISKGPLLRRVVLRRVHSITHSFPIRRIPRESTQSAPLIGTTN